MEISAFLIFIMTKAESKWIWCNQEEFDMVDVFHIEYSVAQNCVVVRIADTKNIIILINMENLQQV